MRKRLKLYPIITLLVSCVSLAGFSRSPAPPPCVTASNTGPYCVGSTLSLSASGPSGATYSWSCPDGFTSTSQNFTRSSCTAVMAGMYYVTATAPGCTATASTFVEIYTPSTLIASSLPGVICNGGNSQLSATMSVGPVSICGPSSRTCSTSFSDYTLGISGGSTFTTSPFRGGLSDGRVQALFLKTELNGAGIQAGVIRSIRLNVNNNGNTVFNNFTIRMACTSLSSLTGIVNPAMTTVFSGSVNPSNGPNLFMFSTPYEWDGVSNLLISFCYDNAGPGITDQIVYTMTSFNSTAFVFNNGGSGCTLTTGSAMGVNGLRPDITFNHCVNASPAITYSWTPASSLSSGSIANPVASPTATTVYTVTATGGACSATASTIVVVDHVTASISPAATTICAGQSVTLTAGYNSSAFTSCGTGADCNSAVTNFLSGANSVSTHSQMFSGVNADARVQYLYRASELLALGMTQGMISSVSIAMVTKNSTQPYTDYTIKMGCTNLNTLASGAFINSGMTIVYSGTYTPVAGPNSFSLSPVWFWDGVSNILVEICFDNSAGSANDFVRGSLPGYACALFSASGGTSGCSLPTGIQANVRANLRFSSCAGYTWSTGSNTTSIIVSPGTSTTYTVTATDGVCSGTANTTVNISTPVVTISPSTVQLTCSSPTATLQANGGVTYVWNNTQTTQNIVINSGGIYSVTGTNALGCTTSASRAVTSNTIPPVANAANNSPICRGRSVQFTASGGGQYSWSGPMGYTASGSRPDRDNLQVLHAGLYTVTVTNPTNGCTATATTNVVVNSCPEICANGVDDDKDGLIDSLDPDCTCRN